MTFYYKGYGRIFVQKEEDIQKVKNKIKEIDDFEYEYLPDDLITVWNKDLNDLIYTYKFDGINIDNLCEELKKNGIKAAWVRGDEVQSGYYHYSLTPSQAKLMYKAGFMKNTKFLKSLALIFWRIDCDSKRKSIKLHGKIRCYYAA